MGRRMCDKNQDFHKHGRRWRGEEQCGHLQAAQTSQAWQLARPGSRGEQVGGSIGGCCLVCQVSRRCGAARLVARAGGQEDRAGAGGVEEGARTSWNLWGLSSYLHI